MILAIVLMPSQRNIRDLIGARTDAPRGRGGARRWAAPAWTAPQRPQPPAQDFHEEEDPERFDGLS